MKINIINLTFLYFLFLTGCNSVNSINYKYDIIGSWYSGDSLLFTFKSNNKFEISYHGERGMKQTKGTYLVQGKKLLKRIKFNNIKKFQGSLHGIFTFIDHNTIKISKLSKKLKTRAIYFEKNNYLIIKREIIQ